MQRQIAAPGYCRREPLGWPVASQLNPAVAALAGAAAVVHPQVPAAAAVSLQLGSHAAPLQLAAGQQLLFEPLSAAFRAARQCRLLPAAADAQPPADALLPLRLLMPATAPVIQQKLHLQAAAAALVRRSSGWLLAAVQQLFLLLLP